MNPHSPETLIDALNSAPPERPFVTAWSDDEAERETVTFGEFRSRSALQAATLRDHGIVRGDRVVILMPQNIDAMATFAGAMSLGAVPAFLAYPNFKVEAVKYRFGLAGVTKNLAATLVVIDQNYPDDLLSHISVGGDAKLVRSSNSGDSGVERILPSPIVSPDDLAFIQHSAGTTGLQKGVALTHASVSRQLTNLVEVLKINASTDRIYSWLPLYHDMGLIACFILPMYCHLPLVMQSPVEWVMKPGTMLEIISEYRCTLAWMPNFAFQFISRRTPRARLGRCDLSSARAIINCSEPVQDASMEEFYESFRELGLKREALQCSYAMAENVFAVTQSALENASGVRRVWADPQIFRASHSIASVGRDSPGALTFVSCGKLLPNNEVRIASDSGANLEEGNVGEILIRSDSLFTGYFNRPDLTEQAFTEGWYRSGDLGFLADGELYVVGRKKDLLIIGGENIYPQDLENAACEHPAIHDGRAVAVGLYNPGLGTEEIVLVAEVERDELLSDQIVIEQEVRSLIVASTGISIRTILLKPSKWIVKSTAGKPARSATREKLLKEHPEIISPR